MLRLLWAALSNIWLHVKEVYLYRSRPQKRCENAPGQKRKSNMVRDLICFEVFMWLIAFKQLLTSIFKMFCNPVGLPFYSKRTERSSHCQSCSLRGYAILCSFTIFLLVVVFVCFLDRHNPVSLSAQNHKVAQKKVSQNSSARIVLSEQGHCKNNT